MNTTGKNYQATSIGDIQTKGRVTLHNELALTGSEVSINELPPGVSVPFLHSHKRNEEVYIVVKGKGRFQVDGDEFEVAEGSVIRVDPAGARMELEDNPAGAGNLDCRLPEVASAGAQGYHPLSPV